jgi:3-oxoacyl-[acyl-carrier protein] reductase
MLTGKAVVITGAAQGVGRGLALAAGKAGASVAVTARKLEAAESVADEIRTRGGAAFACRCDATIRGELEDAVRTTLARFGRLDAVVHNATSRFSGRGVALETVTDEDWDDQVAVGLRGTYLCAQASFAALKHSKGTLVVLTSNAGIEGSLPLPVYSAIKGAQRALVKSLAREWGPDGVRVNALAPVAMTPAMESFFEAQPKMRNYIEFGAALRRIGDAEADIGRALNFLIGDESGFITGQTLLVNGGATMV